MTWQIFWHGGFSTIFANDDFVLWQMDEISFEQLHFLSYLSSLRTYLYYIRCLLTFRNFFSFNINTYGASDHNSRSINVRVGVDPVGCVPLGNFAAASFGNGHPFGNVLKANPQPQ